MCIAVCACVHACALTGPTAHQSWFMDCDNIPEYVQYTLRIYSFLMTYVCPFSSAFSYSHIYESVTVENAVTGTNVSQSLVPKIVIDRKLFRASRRQWEENTRGNTLFHISSHK